MGLLSTASSQFSFVSRLQTTGSTPTPTPTSSPVLSTRMLTWAPDQLPQAGQGQMIFSGPISSMPSPNNPEKYPAPGVESKTAT